MAVKPKPAAKPKPPPTPRQVWERVRRAEYYYAARLRKIAQHISHLASGFPDAGTDAFKADQLAGLLDLYARALQPWAAAEGARMVAEVARRDKNAWLTNSKKMARILRAEIETAPTGLVLQQQSRTFAALITSLPEEAALRVRELTLAARSSGTRPADLEAEIQRSGQVSQGRARLIARTEVARTASLLTQVRSEHIGATHYIWRTVKDGDVRLAHKRMEGVTVAWSTPPTLSDGTTTHAGQIYNCRCFPEPIFD